MVSWPVLQAFVQHPLKPDALRIEQLHEPWEEGVLASCREQRGRADGFVDFDTACAFLPPALFNRDPEFERSIFLSGASDVALHVLHVVCDADGRHACHHAQERVTVSRMSSSVWAALALGFCALCTSSTALPMV
jgi:hypothetical protein